MSTSETLAWLAEEACMNAWPAPREMLVDGFLLRAAGGPTRRTNSVNPLRGERHDSSAVIETCERIYAGLGRSAIFRVPDIAEGMDGPLERVGFRAFAPCRTLFADLSEGTRAPDPDVGLSKAPGEAWLAARSRINEADAETDRVYRTMTETILLPSVFAAIEVDCAVVSVAYAALDRTLVVIESVGTLAPMRGRGYGRRVVCALMNWGRRLGAAGAVLQVVADNAPARALYDALGFRREVLSYHYRQR